MAYTPDAADLAEARARCGDAPDYEVEAEARRIARDHDNHARAAIGVQREIDRAANAAREARYDARERYLTEPAY